MKKIVLLLILLAVGIGGYFGYREWVAEQEQLQREYIELFGNVEIRRVNLGFRVFGKIDRIFFEEGNFVKQGEEIATLDRRPYEENLAVSEALHAKASADLERLVNGARPQEIEQARATLDSNKASLKELEADYERYRQLHDRKAATDSEYETAIARRDEAAANVKKAEETLNLLIEGTRREEIAAGRAMLAQATANLEQAKTALADTTLVSPNDGIILTRVEEPGAVVQPGQTVVTLSLKDAIWAYVYIPEPDRGKVFKGMKAEIYTDSPRGEPPKKPYPGHVGYISPEAEFTPKNVETLKLRTALVYRVRIIADTPDSGLQQGMPVTVRLLIPLTKD